MVLVVLVPPPLSSLPQSYMNTGMHLHYCMYCTMYLFTVYLSFSLCFCFSLSVCLLCQSVIPRVVSRKLPFVKLFLLVLEFKFPRAGVAISEPVSSDFY